MLFPFWGNGKRPRRHGRGAGPEAAIVPDRGRGRAHAIAHPELPLQRGAGGRAEEKCNIVGTLGNHEFDEGVDEMLRLIEGGNHADGPFLEPEYGGADFPYVNANVIREDSGETVIPPYVIRRVDGMPVGVQIVGPWHGEERLIRIAAALEPGFGWRDQWPPLALRQPSAGTPHG